MATTSRRTRSPRRCSATTTLQCRAIKKYFGELAAYARDYARSVGREIIVSGNFFNLEPMYLALADDVDLVITEMRNTTYRQPEWYRYVAAFSGDKDVVVVENPYGGVVPELIELLAVGEGSRPVSAGAPRGRRHGVNMSVPYGSWMGSVIEDSFYAPHGLATEVQPFLADHEHLFARRTVNEVAVVFSVESTRELIGKADASDNTRTPGTHPSWCPTASSPRRLRATRSRSTWSSTPTV